LPYRVLSVVEGIHREVGPTGGQRDQTSGTGPLTLEVEMPHAPVPDSIGAVVDPRRLGARRWWALGALVMAVIAVGLDATVLSVALPTLAGKLHASESDLQWFSSSYLLVLAAAMLPAGLLGDRYGRKKVLLSSLALFAVGSAACAVSPSSGAFIAARVLLGLAGAGIIVMSLSALAVLFSEQERPRAVGIWGAATFVALRSMGGATPGPSWRWSAVWRRWPGSSSGSADWAARRAVSPYSIWRCFARRLTPGA
jgi:MFS family permease